MSKSTLIEMQYESSTGLRWFCLRTGRLYLSPAGKAWTVVGEVVSNDGGRLRVLNAEGDYLDQVLPDLPPQDYPEQAFKADAGKPDFALLTQGCPNALRGVVEVLSFAVRPKEQGGKGYEPHSWQQVPDNKRRYESALHRHLNAINLGEELDDESGLSHWFHVACNAMFLAELYNTEEKS